MSFQVWGFLVLGLGLAVFVAWLSRRMDKVEKEQERLARTLEAVARGLSGQDV